MSILKWVSGIFFLMFLAGTINPEWMNKDSKTRPITRKETFAVSAVCLALFFIFGHFSSSTNNPTTTASAPVTTPSNASSTLTSSDIMDYENGVILQANHTLNSAQNGVTSLSKDLSNGVITLDEFHDKARISHNITNNMYNLFKQQKSPTQLQAITDKYDDLLKQVVNVENQFTTVSQANISNLQTRLNNLISQRASIDQQYAEVKNNVMKTASNQASSATKGSDSNLKPGPDKIAPNGGLGDTFDVIKAAFGDPTRVTNAMNNGAGMYGYKNDKIIVTFANSRAINVTYQETDLTTEEAQKLAKSMMPQDAKPIKQYILDNQQIYVYQSKELSTLFDPSWFEDKNGQMQSGYFDISYLIDNGKVISVDSFVGDNP